MFVSNKAISFGGVLFREKYTITIEANQFHDNNARWGGVLGSVDSTITVEACGFHDNSASNEGGVLSLDSSITTIGGIVTSLIMFNQLEQLFMQHSYRSIIQHVYIAFSSLITTWLIDML